MAVQLVGALDQGTSSTRMLVFDPEGYQVVASAQRELKQNTPKPGWVEMDAAEILQSCLDCMQDVARQLREQGQGDPGSPPIHAIGITNQRETAVAWDRITGKPLHSAIVWLDQRTAGLAEQYIAKTPGKSKDYLRSRCGLPIHSYFSALKFRWLIDNVSDVRKAVAEGRCLLGTVDAWMIWNLTGGPNGGVHVTDVSNASRTMLMNLRTMTWDTELCHFFDINHALLPAIRCSAEIFGMVADGLPFAGVQIAGCAGDQQAALIGHGCFSPGQAKNTYGTGCFILCNTGSTAIHSNYGLLTTVAYQLGKDQPVCYALEGSVAVAGAGARYLRDNLSIIDSVEELGPLAETAAKQTDSALDENENGGDVAATGTQQEPVYFVPAFSGLFAPHWDASARGLLIGLTQHTTKAHIALALLQAVCFQTADVLDAMCLDGMPRLNELKVSFYQLHGIVQFF